MVSKLRCSIARAFSWIGIAIVIILAPAACKKYTPPEELVATYTAPNRRIFAEIQFSPDGSTLAGVATKFGSREISSLVIWDVGSNSFEKAIGELEWDEGLTSFDVSDDDGTLVTGGGRDHTLRIWSIGDGSLLHVFREHTDWVTDVKYSPDGAYLASIDSDGNVIVRDANSFEIRWQGKEGKSLSSLAFTPDGTTLLTGGTSRRVVPWDVTNGEAGEGFKNVHDPVSEISFSSDGKSFITCDGTYENTVKLWEYPSGKLLYVFEFGKDNTIRSIAYHPHQPIAIAVGRWRYVGVLDLKSGEVTEISSHAGGDYHDVCFSPDGTRYAVSTERGISIFRLDVDGD